MSDYSIFGPYGMTDLSFGLDVLTTFLMVIIFGVLAFGIVCYIFQGIGLYALAKRRGIRAPGLAWVPVLNYWIIGGLGDQQERIEGKKDPRARVSLLVFYILTACCAALVTILMILIVPQMTMASQYTGVYSAVNTNIAIWTAVYMLMLGIAISFCVFYFLSLNRIYRSCAKSYTALSVLSVLFPCIVPFVVFALRKRDANLEPNISTEVK